MHERQQVEASHRSAIPGEANDVLAIREPAIPTVGEYAAQALTAFTELQQFSDARILNPSIRTSSLDLVHACLSLMHKFPNQTRSEFARALPFTALELSLLEVDSTDEQPVVDEIALRLYEWVHRSPILVEESSVHAAEFLRRLSPHLDLWRQRELAAHAIEHVCNLDDDFSDASRVDSTEFTRK